MAERTLTPLDGYFPIPAAYFGMVLGIIGMGSAWRFAAQHWALPAVVGECLMALGVAVWLVLTCVFIYKWLFRRAAALAEVRDAIQCCFISLFPGTTMLVGVAVAIQPLLGFNYGAKLIDRSKLYDPAFTTEFRRGTDR